MATLHHLLYELVENCQTKIDWDAVAARLETHPHEVTEIADEATDYELCMYEGDGYGSPLHLALSCRCPSPPDNIILAMLREFPTAAASHILGSVGRDFQARDSRFFFVTGTALHLAVENPGISADVIQAIVNIEPSCASQPDSNGKIPMSHLFRSYLLLCETPDDLVAKFNILKTVYPEGLEIVMADILSAYEYYFGDYHSHCDDCTCTARQLLMSGWYERSGYPYSDVRWGPIVARVLLRPEESQTVDGECLLHIVLDTHALAYPSKIVPLEAIQALLQADPNAAMVQMRYTIITRERPNYPLRQHLRGNGETALHLAVMNSFVGANIVQVLVDTNADALFAIDDAGNLSLTYLDGTDQEKERVVIDAVYRILRNKSQLVRVCPTRWISQTLPRGQLDSDPR